MEARDRPLKDEAAKRHEWRRADGDPPRPEGGGNSLPASEDEDERAKSEDVPESAAGPLTVAPPPD